MLWKKWKFVCTNVISFSAPSYSSGILLKSFCSYQGWQILYNTSAKYQGAQEVTLL